MTPAIRRKVKRSLIACNAIHGKGDVRAVIWMQPCNNMEPPSPCGIVVRQCGYHMDAVQFTVASDFRTLRMLSQTRPVL